MFRSHMFMSETLHFEHFKSLLPHSFFELEIIQGHDILNRSKVTWLYYMIDKEGCIPLMVLTIQYIFLAPLNLWSVGRELMVCCHLGKKRNPSCSRE